MATKHKKTKHKKTKHKKTKHKKTRNKRVKKGGASLEQIGEASAMRNWFKKEKIRDHLNAIVHSSDKNPWLLSGLPNPYTDITTTYDGNVETILASLRPEYKEKVLEYIYDYIDDLELYRKWLSKNPEIENIALKRYPNNVKIPPHLRGKSKETSIEEPTPYSPPQSPYSSQPIFFKPPPPPPSSPYSPKPNFFKPPPPPPYPPPNNPTI